MVKVYDIDENGSMAQVGQTLYGNTDGDEVQGALALNGKRLALFTPRRDGDAGRVWIFELQSGKWVNIGKIVKPKNSGERFGDAVAISKDGEMIVVGSTFANNKKGKVSVFRYAGGTVWEQMGPDIQGNYADGKFGWNIDIASDASTPTFVVGEKSDDAVENKSRPGQARVYRWESAGSGWWRLLGNYQIDGPHLGDAFGRSVAISADGEIIVSGARFYGIDEAGAALSYKYQGGQYGSGWITQAGVFGDSAGDHFFNVAMNKAGDRIAVGSGTGQGYVKVFDYGPLAMNNGVETWIQVGDTLRGEASGENFGSAVSLSHDGETLLVGSPSRDNSNQPGSVRLYKLAPKGTYPKYPHISPSVQSAGPDDLDLGYSSMSDEDNTRKGGATSPAAAMKNQAMASFVISAFIGVAATLL